MAHGGARQWDLQEEVDSGTSGRYSLIVTVSFVNNIHFTANLRQVDGAWYHYNDLDKKGLMVSLDSTDLAGLQPADHHDMIGFLYRRLGQLL